MVIYADILLAVNWWIDFLLLAGVGYLTGGIGKGWRMALGSLCGGISGFIIFLPKLSIFLSMVLKLAIAIIMTLVAFGIKEKKRFIKQIIWLFALSAGMAGCCSALYFFVAPIGLTVYNGTVYYPVPPLLLVGLTALCYCIMRLGEWWLRRRIPSGSLYQITVEQNGRSVTLTCFYDSGNQLTEPFSGCPVVVAERKALSTLDGSNATVADLPPGWRVIPFESVGGDGLLPAFLPQKLILSTSGKRMTVEGCYIALCEQLGHEEYQALIGPSLCERIG